MSSVAFRYGAPPVGDFRWRPPTKPEPWMGVRNATVFSPDCMQLNYDGTGLWTTGSSNQSEDCLYLNVWAPQLGVPGRSDKLPVYVWYHGGRFTNGAGDVITYDGTGLAEEGIIVVTVNSRMGPLGYLAHPELSAESNHNSSGNYGVMDMQLALEWVYTEIDNFGGDPQRITVGGQSSGSSCALDMMFSPLSSGMVAGVIAESGVTSPLDPHIQTAATSYRRKDEAEAYGLEFVEMYNLTTIAEMRQLNASAFITVAADLANATVLVGTVFDNNSWFNEPPEFRPNLDGYVLPYSYEELLLNAKQGDVPVLTGNNLNEAGSPPLVEVKLSTYQSNFSAIFGDLYDNFTALYPANDTASATLASNTFWRDEARISVWQWASLWREGGAVSPVYKYFWTHAPPNQTLGAFHGSEMYYVFNDLPWNYPNMPWNQTDFDIEHQMVSYWSNFIKTGNPNGANLTYWPAGFDPEIMFLGDEWGVQEAAPVEKRDFILEWFSRQNPW